MGPNLYILSKAHPFLETAEKFPVMMIVKSRWARFIQDGHNAKIFTLVFHLKFSHRLIATRIHTL